MKILFEAPEGKGVSGKT